MNDLTLGPVNHLVLLGGYSLFVDISTYCRQHEIDLSIITSPDQDSSFPDDMSRYSTERIDDQQVTSIVSKHSPKNTLSMSFGARWIFTKQQIQTIFSNRLINVHGTRLPYDRGGGGFSWRIMRNDRLGNLLIHKIDEGLDTGPIIVQEEYVIPRNIQSPHEIENDYLARLKPFLFDFLESVRREEKTFSLTSQNHNISVYHPRLSSEIHSWIDWSLPAEKLVRFITAFDDPYPGAKCEWKNGVCKIKNVQLHGGEAQGHPFQAGIIFRKGDDYITCYTQCGNSILIQDIRDEHGNNIMPYLKVGDRLFTKHEKIYDALSTRAVYTSTGLRR